jgi:hypothetical protein
MSVNRRRFLENAALSMGAVAVMPRAWGTAAQDIASLAAVSDQEKVYGSGYFGNWIEDEFGLPAFH